MWRRSTVTFIRGTRDRQSANASSHFLAGHAYRHLPTSTSIRLVRFDSVENLRGLIRLSTRTVDLDCQPKYGALSYTWGRPISVFQTAEERDHPGPPYLPIVLDGKFVAVTRNLVEFLLVWVRSHRIMANPTSKLAMEAQESGCSIPEELWIDAICINQADADEKSSQVSMMGRIYGQAQKVVIWLGPEDSFTRSALQTMVKVSQATPEQTRAARSVFRDHACEALGLPPIASSAWWPLFALLQREWFRRVWIAQEIAFAPQTHVQCGLLAFHWADLCRTCAVLYESGLGSHMDVNAWEELSGYQMDDSMMVTRDGEVLLRTLQARPESERRLFANLEERVSSYTNILRLESFRAGDGSRMREPLEGAWVLGDRVDSIPFLRMLDGARALGASDPRDKVYALLDLTKRDTHDSDVVSPLRRPLVPDYRLKTEQVYTEAAWYVLLSGDHLQLLMRTSQGSHQGSEKNNKNHAQTDGLPSWVPDWGRIPHGTSTWSLASCAQSRWTAAGALKWKVSQDVPPYGKTLRVTGIFVGNIAEVVESETFSLGKSGRVAAGLPEVYPWISGTATARGEVLWRTLIADHDHSGYSARDFSNVFYDVWVREKKRVTLDIYRSDKMPVDDLEEYSYLTGYTDILFPNLEELKKRWEAEKDRSRVSLQVAKHVDFPLPAPLSAEDKIWLKKNKAVLGSTTHNSITAQPLSQFDKLSEYLFKELQKKRDDDGGGSSDASSVKDPRRKLPLLPPTPPALEFHDLLVTVSSTRRVFRTVQGHLGNGPVQARPGDQVWVLAGGDVPFILRPQGQDGAFVLVGSAYVHGIMHGEVLGRETSQLVNVDLV